MVVRKGKKKVTAPVREEKTVDKILNSLVGIAKENFLMKWRRWVEELILTYNLEDPQEIGYDPDRVEEFLREWCSGLVENECFERIKTLIIEHGGRVLAEEMGNALNDYYEYVKKNPKSLCIELSLDTETCDEILKIRENPCLDHDKAYKILKAFMVRWGVPEEVADEEASRIAREVIPNVRCTNWDQVLRVAQSVIRDERVSRYLTLDRWFRKEGKVILKPTVKGRVSTDVETLNKLLSRLKDIKHDAERLYYSGKVDELKELIDEVEEIVSEVNRISNKCVLRRDTTCYTTASQVSTEAEYIRNKVRNYINRLKSLVSPEGKLVSIPKADFFRWGFKPHMIPSLSYDVILRSVKLYYLARGKRVVEAEVKGDDVRGLHIYYSYRYEPKVCFVETNKYERFLGCNIPVVATLELDDKVIIKFYGAVHL